MILDVEKVGDVVRTPDGPGVITIVEQDIKTFENYAIVRLDEDKSLVRYMEHELDTITIESEKETCTGLVKDSDVIKALECCSLSNTHQQEECDKCPFNEIPLTICQNLLAYHALQIIKRSTR